jgi:hypothetical protein
MLSDQLGILRINGDGSVDRMATPEEIGATGTKGFSRGPYAATARQLAALTHGTTGLAVPANDRIVGLLTSAQLRTIAGSGDPRAARAPAPWDEPGGVPFPQGGSRSGYARALLEQRAGEGDTARLVAAAETALHGNWRLLDGVSA